ncbi:MAG: glycosyltransferase [bacterium]|nr:glycosyltransferase [bacterium]
MKILFISTAFPNPRNLFAGIFIYHRASALKQLGHDVQVLTFNNVLNRHFKMSWLHSTSTDALGLGASIRITAINYLRLPTLSDGFVAKRIAAFAKQWGADIVHFHFLWDALSGPLLSSRYKVPYLITGHGCDVNRVSSYPTGKKNRYVAAMQGAKAMICVSSYLLKKAVALGFNGTGIVIPNGINGDIFKLPVQKGRSAIKRVGFVGSLLPIKRADALPCIFQHMFAKHSQLEFVVIGTGSLGDSIQRQCEEASLPCRFAGQLSQTDLALEYQAFDLLILPSRSEGWPCVVIEAQACGVPVVGANVCGLSEAIGKGGCVVDDGDDFERRFAQACLSQLEHPIAPQHLHERAQDYTWHAIALRESEVYSQCVA